MKNKLTLINPEKHHIIPQSLSKKELEFFPELKKDKIERWAINKTVSLSQKEHVGYTKKVQTPSVKEIFIAAHSECSEEPCLYKEYYGIKERSKEPCHTCKILRTFDLLNFYDYFGQDFGLPFLLFKKIQLPLFFLKSTRIPVGVPWHCGYLRNLFNGDEKFKRLILKRKRLIEEFESSYPKFFKCFFKKELRSG